MNASCISKPFRKQLSYSCRLFPRCMNIWTSQIINYRARLTLLYALKLAQIQNRS
ncbi:hypothetical protein BABINDRAFT_74886 [Babjeviella inositovora NRRL Y-12698]|uniref:Uncharacterized protein n=1 Tax=Babjeviella inositovora NRRL Y-12698 TaxID=984486 RepID=A0A1E3QYC6_9ASCO|nr:uncharacterized protein BABINDRAFT_74886 [Babjeviella inositovora NRRL Y-12698]ODQ82670.1 hypothetical protein BABINDRAFT_74886 [Babjeviella inositovora NRRL Y-12698]